MIGFSSFEFKPNNLWTIVAGRDQLTLGIEFPLQVKIDQLRVHLAVTDKNGKPASFELQPGTNPKAFRLLIKGTAALAWPIKVRVTRDLTDSEGLLSLGRDYSSEYGRPEEKVLSLFGAKWGEINETTQTIQFAFSENIDPARLARLLKVMDISTTNPRELKFIMRDVPNYKNNCLIAFSAPDPYDVKVLGDNCSGNGEPGEASDERFVEPGDGPAHGAGL